MKPDLEVVTAYGPARATLTPPASGTSRGLVALGHGAGGGINAPDLVAVTTALSGAGWTVARVEQPYRVAGRRAASPAAALDSAWIAVVTALREASRGPLVLGGRSSGARVACRTAAALDAAAVLCLAFPLRPPRRPQVTRLGELLAVDVPVLVVQGERDPFGGPGEFPATVGVAAVPGDHALRRTPPVVAAVLDWLDGQPLPGDA
jgi:predicted alpha/beta-hydrolase family hydrolase